MYVVDSSARKATITLTGEEVAVKFPCTYSVFGIKGDSMLLYPKSGMAQGDDGVYDTAEGDGLTLKYTFDNSGRDKIIRFFAVNTTTQAEEYIFRETSGVREYESATLQVTDPTTGEVQVTYHWHPNYDPSDHRTTTRTYTYGFLVGFGTNGHTYSVEDSGY